MSGDWDRAEFTLGRLPQYDVQRRESDGMWQVFRPDADAPLATCVSFEEAMGWVFGWWSQQSFALAADPAEPERYGVAPSLKATKARRRRLRLMAEEELA